MSNTAKPLDGIEAGKRDEFVIKQTGPVFLFQGVKHDLRNIDYARACALADHPQCAFIAWKDPKKRPEGQRGVFAVSAASTPAAKPAAAPAAGEK